MHMTWGQEMVTRWRSHVASGGDRPSVEHGGWHLHVEAHASGPVGLSAGRVVVRTPAAGDPGRAAAGVARRVTYLLEPLRLIEAGDGRALVRSAPAEKGPFGEVRDYYEMWITRADRGTEVELRRYRYSRATRRRTPLPIDITWEVAGRLLDDVRDSLLAALEEAEG